MYMFTLLSQQNYDGISKVKTVGNSCYK